MEKSDLNFDIGNRRILSDSLKELEEKIEKNMIEPLLKERDRMLKDKIEAEEKLKESKESISKLEAKIESIFYEGDIKEFEGCGLKIFFSNEMYTRVIDPSSLFKWMEENDHYDILCANIIRRTNVNNLIDSGIVPDGISVDTYRKFKIHKSRKKNEG